MILTITNASSTDELTVKFPFCIPETTIAASGNATFGVSMSDLIARGDITGYKATQYIDNLVKTGLATAAVAADANDSNIEDLANEL